MIFLSHSSQDKRLARWIVEALSLAGLPVWFDEQQMRPGDELTPSIKSAIDASSVFLYLCSQGASASAWCRLELKVALERRGFGGFRIVPVVVRDSQDSIPDLIQDLIHLTVPSDLRSDGHAFAQSLGQLVPNIAGQKSARIAVTARLRDQRLLTSFPDLPAGLQCPLSLLPLDADFNRLDDAYNALSGASVTVLPKMSRPEQEQLDATVAGLHARCRRVIDALPTLARDLATGPAPINNTYEGQARLEMLHVLLNNLHETTIFLRSYTKSDPDAYTRYVERRDLDEPYTGMRCDFVYPGGKFVAHVPKNRSDLQPGLVPLRGELEPAYFGRIAGHSLAEMYLAGNLKELRLPDPNQTQIGPA